MKKLLMFIILGFLLISPMAMADVEFQPGTTKTVEEWNNLGLIGQFFYNLFNPGTFIISPGDEYPCGQYEGLCVEGFEMSNCYWTGSSCNCLEGVSCGDNGDKGDDGGDLSCNQKYSPTQYKCGLTDTNNVYSINICGGDYQLYQTCGSKTCVAGSCVSEIISECNPGESKCVSDSRFVCSSDGLWRGSSCSISEVCTQVSSTNAICESVEKECNVFGFMECTSDTTYNWCNNDLGKIRSETCESGFTCEDSKKACTKEGGDIIKCSEDSDCEIDEKCKGAFLAAKTCKEFVCTGNQRMEEHKCVDIEGGECLPSTQEADCGGSKWCAPVYNFIGIFSRFECQAKKPALILDEIKDMSFTAIRPSFCYYNRECLDREGEDIEKVTCSSSEKVINIINSKQGFTRNLFDALGAKEFEPGICYAKELGLDIDNITEWIEDNLVLVLIIVGGFIAVVVVFK